MIAAVEDALRTHWHNPSSVHRAGQAARQQVELARQSMADLIGVKAREVTFTSGGTEAIDLAIRGTLEAMPATRRGLLTTAVEHAAVRDLAAEWERLGNPVSRAPVSLQGIVDVDDLAQRIGPSTGIVSIQWANNETGAVQPVDAIYELCQRRGVMFHCDATQWVGKIPVAGTPPCDLLTCSPHKFHGPKGIGGLWARAGTRLRPQLYGTQELGRRGGTENVPGIVGAGVAAEEAAAWLGDGGERTRLAGLRDRFEELVRAGVGEMVVNGVASHLNKEAPPSPLAARGDHTSEANPRPNTLPPGGGARLWNTTNIGFPHLEAEALLMLLSEQGVCASAGAACSSGSLDPSPVLLAMGIPEAVAHGSVRFSLSRHTTKEEIEEAAGIVVRCVKKLRGEMAV